jgi:hypothetical protein
MAKIDLLRRLIREEVEAALRNQLPKIIKESLESKPISYKSSLENSVKSKAPPLTLNTKRNNVLENIKFSSSNPFASMLNETITSMTPRDVNSINNSGESTFYQPEEFETGTVNDMLSSAKPSSAHELVEIDTVPDFTELMESMKRKGVL